MASAFDNLIGMFNKASTTTTAAATPQSTATPGSQVPAAGPAQGSNVQAFQQSATLPPKEQSPLAEYADLFNNAPVEGAEVPVTLDDPYLVVDKDKVKEFVNSKSFLNSSPEQLALVAKALGGDAQAFMEVLEGFGRNLYMDAALNSTHVAERIARTGVSRLQAAIPQQIRSMSSAEKMTALNPIFSNPALKPLADAMKTQFEAKHPTATPQQIAEMTAKYFKDTGVMFNPAPAASQTNANTGTDFSNW
jgi:hypothetical protein